MSASASEAIALLLASPGGYLFAAVWGALWGSFWNVAIHRLAREDASLGMLVRPPSHCPHCSTPIRAFDNVPLVGWLLLRGRCRSCKAPISIRYPLVEAAGLGFGLAVYQLFVLGHPDEVALMLCRFLVYFFFVGTLFVLAAIDLDTFLLPDAIVLPAIPVFFLGARILGDISLVDALVGAGAGWAIFKSLEIVYPLFSRWRRRRRLARQAAAEGWSPQETRQALEEEQGIDGVGGGDAKLMALIGAVLGWRSLPFTLGLGSMIGVAVVAPRLLTTWLAARRQGAAPASAAETTAPVAQSDGGAEGEPDEARSLGETEIPYGPFLVAGALCYLFLRDLVWAWMMGWVDAP